MWQEVGDNCKAVMRETMLEFVSTINGSLNPGKGGKKKIFRDGTVENLLEFLEIFEARNKLVNDTELQGYVNQAKALLKGKANDIEGLSKAIRNDDGFRTKIKKEWAKMTDGLAAIADVTEDTWRSIDMDELLS